MLLYYNGNVSRQLFQRFGSLFWSTSTIAIASAVAVSTLGVKVISGTTGTVFMDAMYMPMLGGIVTIAIVFRTNQAWNRYWEAVTNLHYMYSKWADAFSQFCGFVSVTIMKRLEIEGEHAEEEIAKLHDMHQKVQNDFLLLSAMACDRICRGDCSLIARRDDNRVAWKDRIAVREDLRNCNDVFNVTGGMPSFRKSAVSHVRRSASNDERQDDVNIKGFWDAEYVVIKPPTGTKYDLLAKSFDRANMVVNWLNHNLAFCSSALAVAAPIQSRMFQEISNGMLGFNNTLKVADVPIAFPYSQLIIIMLLLWNLSIPFYVANLTKSNIAGPGIAFLLSACMLCLNGIAAELENPFGQGANQLCVPEFHSRFLLVVTDASRSCYHPPRPPKSHMNARTVSEMRVYSEYLNSCDGDKSDEGDFFLEVPTSDHRGTTSCEEHNSPDRSSQQSMQSTGVNHVDSRSVEIKEPTELVDILEITRRTLLKQNTKHELLPQDDLAAPGRNSSSSVQDTREEPHIQKRQDGRTKTRDEVTGRWNGWEIAEEKILCETAGLERNMTHQADGSRCYIAS